MKHLDRRFLLVLSIATAVAALTYRIPALAMWVGFSFAAYSVIANDSIQTLGTFLTSNRNRPWWLLWLFTASIFLATTLYSFVEYGGDVAYARLATKGFETAPTSFSFLQLCAPLVLLVLTKMAVPVSTTFLILSTFTTSSESLAQIVFKSISGYVIAFICAFGLWMLSYHWFQRARLSAPSRWWMPAQWCTTGLLWSVWIMQDAANIAVYLPRSLSVGELIAYCSIIVAGLGFLMYHGGGVIQGVVAEKHQTTDVRQATLVDFVYAIVLYYFKTVSNMPMSTTWVFIGILAGRELGISLASKQQARTGPEARRLISRDLQRVGIGLVISVLLAVIINPVMRMGILGF